MEAVEYLVVGAGMSGLSFANWIRQEADRRGAAAPSVLVVEADDEPGGYCKTVTRDGFVWDYSGHFFHFRDPAIERWLRARMPGQDIRTVAKRSFIRFAGRDIDFPFQKNIHQLPRADFIDCLVDLYFAAHGEPAPDAKATATATVPGSFKDMLRARLGRGIADRFLIPYNEKLYACDLDALDPDAMGRFFPHADIADIIGNMRRPDNASYNATFTYPRGGAVQYVRALLRDLPPAQLCCRERVVAVDLARRVATTARRADGGGWADGRRIRYERLVSSAPLPRLLAACGIDVPAGVLSSNKVLVYNLGFDRKGDPRPHWIYFPEREYCFYRVGFYDNIMDDHADARMSLYVEIGMGAAEPVDVEATRARVLADLARAGIVDGHELVSWHSVVLDPAYVHITGASRALFERLAPALHAAGVYPVGRYGGWTYCSIEDNLLETRALAERFALSM